MSHFTKAKAEITNLDYLKKALNELKVDYIQDQQGLEIKNFYGDKTHVDLLIPTGTEYDIGLHMLEGGSYEIIADWELLKKSKFDCEGFQNSIQQKYAYITVKETLKDQGYEFEEESVDENGNISMVVSQW